MRESDSLESPEPESLESPHKGQRGIRRIVNAIFYSLSGLALAFRHESAFRQEIVLAIVLIPAACFLPASAVERVSLIGSELLVLIVELLNSSVEAAVDRIGSAYNYSYPCRAHLLIAQPAGGWQHVKGGGQQKVAGDTVNDKRDKEIAGMP